MLGVEEELSDEVVIWPCGMWRKFRIAANSGHWKMCLMDIEKRKPQCGQGRGIN